MLIANIKPDREEFRHHLALHLEADKPGGVMAAVDVITRSERSAELRLVVKSTETLWYCDEALYGDYESAFKGLGNHLDAISQERTPSLNNGWAS